MSDTTEATTPRLETTRRAFEGIQLALANRVLLLGGTPDQTTALQGALIALTVQHTALLSLLVDRGAFTSDQYHEALARHAVDACAQYMGDRDTPTH